jgi:hypothetical protein
MVEPIHPLSGPIPPHKPQIKAVPGASALADQMKAQVTSFASHLQMLLEDPTLSTRQSFLKDFANNVTHLHQTVHQVLSMRP